MERDCGVYALLNTATGKVYVGSSVHVRTRYSDHITALKRGAHCNAHLQHAWNRDAAAFAVGVLEWCAPANLEKCEQGWIIELRAADRDYGYNLMTTCERGFTPSPETRALLSAAQKGRKVIRSPEHQAKLNAAMKNRPPRTHSPETRTKISAVQCGRSVSPETRAKISAKAAGRKNPAVSEANRRRVHSPETRMKLGVAGVKGNAALRRAQRAGQAKVPRRRNHNSTGHVCSPETRAKLSAAARNRSSEYLAKQSAAHKGQPAHNKGKPTNPEVTAKRIASYKATIARKRAERAQAEQARNGASASCTNEEQPHD